MHLGIPGRHNVMNALAAATVAMRYGMAPETVARILASQHTISPHRMALSTVNREGTSFTLIDDSFNANPDSMKAGLNGLKAWNSNDGKEPFRVALLGAMLELGADETALHTSGGRCPSEPIRVGGLRTRHRCGRTAGHRLGSQPSRRCGTAQGIARVRPERFG